MSLGSSELHRVANLRFTSPHVTPHHNTPIMPPQLLTRPELAAHLNISTRYVDVLTAKGSIPHFKIGRSIRYDIAEVEAVMKERFHVAAKLKRHIASIHSNLEQHKP